MQTAERKRKSDSHLQLPLIEQPNRIEALDETSASDDVERAEAIPFVKWVGGKRSVIECLKVRLPAHFGKYYEPFVGGGALFFEIRRKILSARLSDTNLDLMLTYKAIQKEPTKVLAQLRAHAKDHSDDYYYSIRSSHNLERPVDIAARFLYLNRTCYNGLYRVNKKGEFNVPVGDYVKPGIVQEENIMACSRTLQGDVVLEFKNYSAIEPAKGDFVYFDPPYHPTDETSFTAYSVTDFTEKDQANLAKFAKALHEAGVKLMLSNSNTKFIRDLYRSSIFKVEIINAPRMVNCKPGGRRPVEEVLITNY